MSTADNTASSGSYSSLALAPDGSPHMAYYESEFQNLRHAWRPPGGTWQNEAVDTPGLVGQYTSIGIADGNIYISYYDATAPGLKVATKPLAGGSWSIELPDASAVVGLFTALSPTPRLTVAYFDLTNSALKVATKIDNVWNLETVDSFGDVGRYASIAQDPGNTYIAYYDNFQGNLKFAERHLDGPWQVMTLASNGDVGHGTAVAIDNHRRPHVVYYRADTEDLLYAGRYKGAWAYDVIATGGNVGRFSGIGFQAEDYPYVAYYDQSNGTLRFAHGVGEPTGVTGTRMELPSPIAGLAPLANPSRTGAEFTFELDRQTPLLFQVFDVQGRAVRTLQDGPLRPGFHRLAWDGRDHAGKPVVPGSYFARVAVPGQAVTTRVVLLR